MKLLVFFTYFVFFSLNLSIFLKVLFSVDIILLLKITISVEKKTKQANVSEVNRPRIFNDFVRNY